MYQEHFEHIKIHKNKAQVLHVLRHITWWIPAIFEKSSGGIHQSNKLRFSLILDSFTLFGRTLCPLWIPQRRATCAGDLFSFSAISTKIGSFMISPFNQVPGDPRGEYPCNNFPLIMTQTAKFYEQRFVKMEKYREMNTSGFAQIVKGRLLPNWMTLHLIDCRWNFCIWQQVLQLLSREVAHPDCSCLTGCKQALHCIPCLRETQRSRDFRGETLRAGLCPKWPMYL